MKEKDINAVNIILNQLYNSMDYIEINENFLKMHNIDYDGKTILLLSKLLVNTGFAEKGNILTDSHFEVKITQKGLHMMMVYGSFKEYLNDSRAKKTSNRLMYTLAILVAIATITSAVINIYATFFK